MVTSAQCLGEDSHKASRQLHTNLGLLPGWKHIHHAVDGLCCRAGVECSEHKVSCLSGADRQLDCFQVTHFTHKNHVWVFTQSCTQSIREATGVLIQLTLVDQTFVALVHKFDRVFDRENVFAAGVIDVIEKSGQGGCFS